MLIHNLIRRSTVNGPGTRAVIWFQYCPIHCKGCWNPETWKVDGTYIKRLSEIYEWLDSLDEDIEGITFSGGEPMSQFDEVLRLIDYIRQYHNHWSIGMFSGFSEEVLEAGKYKLLGLVYSNFLRRINWQLVKDSLDFAVLGPFQEDKVTTEIPLIGSYNQTLKLYSDRYSIKDFKKQEIEITISPQGLVQITGFPVGIHQELDKELWPEIVKT